MFPMYRVTHKEWDGKDDLKLLNNYDIVLPFIYSLIGLFYWLGKKETYFAVNYKYKETDCKIPYSRLWSLILCGVLFTFHIFVSKIIKIRCLWLKKKTLNSWITNKCFNSKVEFTKGPKKPPCESQCDSPPLVV